jgi:hypothetical protein
MNIRYLWVLMAVISVTLFLFQVSVDSLSSNANSIYKYDGSIVQAYNKGGSGVYVLDDDINSGMPELPTGVSSESSNEFTDLFKTIQGWFQNTKSGKIIYGLYYAVPSVLNNMGLPSEFSFAFGVLWTLLSIFSFIMFMRGVM